MPRTEQITPVSEQKNKIFLTPRERYYLWLLAQGRTPSETRVIMSTTAAPNHALRVKHKLKARTMEQAIYIACELALIGPYPECGTMHGYRSHRGRHEDACRACAREFAEYADRNGTATVKRVVLTEAEARLLRALDAGRKPRQIARNWSITEAAVRYHITHLYRKMDVSHLPQNHRMPALLEEGRHLGYLLPDREANPAFHREPRQRQTNVLTDLETQTLKVLAQPGVTLAQAGAQLGGIPGTSVSSRLAIVYRKLDVLSYGHGERRAAAIKEARNRGYDV